MARRRYPLSGLIQTSTLIFRHLLHEVFALTKSVAFPLRGTPTRMGPFRVGAYGSLIAGSGASRWSPVTVRRSPWTGRRQRCYNWLERSQTT